MIKTLKYATRLYRNSFWHFVQNFWCYHGGMGYDDEWHATPGRFYSDIRILQFKNSFPYHLELSKIGRKYHLSISVRFNCQQNFSIANILNITSKKEAIRVTFKSIKNFENDKTKIMEMWNQISYDIPIVDADGIWRCSVLIGSADTTLIHTSLNSKNATLGYGDFYSLHFEYNVWTWTKHNITSMGHSSLDCKCVSFMIWKAIYGYNPILDTIIDEAIIFAQQNPSFDIIEEVLSEQYMQAFYDSQF
jgi:hypothetical protein